MMKFRQSVEDERYIEEESFGGGCVVLLLIVCGYQPVSAEYQQLYRVNQPLGATVLLGIGDWVV